MKKKFIVFSMMAAANLFAPKMYAQGGVKSVAVNFKTPVGEKSVEAPEVSELVAKTQNEKFRGATNLKWETLENKQTVCIFSLDNSQYRALYNRNGHLRWTEKSYSGQYLNQDLRDMIFRYYGEVTIQSVKEFEVPQSSINYFVVISKDQDIMRIRIVDQEIDTLETYSK